jgi:hypothetical protein
MPDTSKLAVTGRAVAMRNDAALEQIVGAFERRAECHCRD